MSELEPNESGVEEESSEPTIEKLISALREVMPDLEESEFEGMDFQDALGEAYGLLMQAGEDPDSFLAEKGLLETPDDSK